MFSIDIPAVPLQDPPAIVAQAVAADRSTGQGGIPATAQRFDRTFRSCQDVEWTAGVPLGAQNDFALLPAVLRNLGYWDKAKRDFRVPAEVLSQIKSSVLEPPKHGQILQQYPEAPHIWSYQASRGYVGKDSATFLVEAKGKRFRIVVNMLVVKSIDQHLTPECESVRFDRSLGPNYVPSGGVSAYPGVHSLFRISGSLWNGFNRAGFSSGRKNSGENEFSGPKGKR